MQRIKKLFYKHKKSVVIGEYLDNIGGNHYQKKYLHKCSVCGKEW